jgi:cell division protein ZapA (FtsZ GTPase activity inhibitor)
MGKDSVAVRIAGHEYKIRSGGDAEALREIASYVDRAMARVRERTGTVDTIDVAVLTCLNLAREIISLHEDRVPSGATAVDGDKLRSLIERVESSLGQAPLVSVSEEGSGAGQGEPSDSAERKGEEESRTLELPPVEALRDRAAARNDDSEVTEATIASSEPERRVASGGRDRAS